MMLLIEIGLTNYLSVYKPIPMKKYILTYNMYGTDCRFETTSILIFMAKLEEIETWEYVVNSSISFYTVEPVNPLPPGETGETWPKFKSVVAPVKH